MKKIFTTLAAAMSALALMATTYTGQLTVTVNGESLDPIDNVKIIIAPNGDNFDFTLSNFSLGEGAEVGDIAVTNIPASRNGVLNAMYVDEIIQIHEGNLPGVDYWMGPDLGDIPLKMLARFAAQKYLVVDIDIDMSETLGQVISVHFDNSDNGSKFQMPNSNFEEWTNKTQEPRYWHGFASADVASGIIGTTAKKATVVKDTDVRPGTTGKTSAKITSNYFIVKAVNGTMTNGQLSAKSTTPDDKSNHSHMDSNSTAKDLNGDPYFMGVYGKPDAVRTWLKYTQAKSNSKWKATLSAIIFDTNINSYYQDPKNDNENNVAAKASNTSISAGGWTEYTVPFNYATYANNNATGNAILLTISTNATPGTGSSSDPYDNVWVDDMELVYNANLSNVKFQGNDFGFTPTTTEYSIFYEGEQTFTADDFTAEIDGVGAVIVKSIVATEDGYQVIIAPVAGDLTAKIYTINLTRVTPVADVLAKGVELQDYILKEDMKVVAESDVNGVAGFVTDGTHWMRLNFFGQDICPTVGTVMGHIKGTYNGNALAPAIDVLSYEDGTSSISENVRTINLAHNFAMPVASEVANVIGWYEEGGTLRGFAGNPGGQSLSLYNEFDPMGTSLDEVMEAGKQYKVVVAFEIKEAWAAPRRINSADYDYDFQNLTGVVLGSPEELLPTAVENVEAASEVKSVRYIDAMGRVHNAPVDGINIVVTEMANGTTSTVKVVR